MRRNRCFILRTCLAITLAAASARAQSTLYVDDDAPLGGNGQSWATAYDDLQPAITAAVASAGTVTEIHVAAGIYHPAPPNGSRVAIFILRENLAIWGGYAGINTANPDERDFVTHESILSGDLNGNDGSNFTNSAENSYHVVGASDVGPTAELDGFTITAGNANGSNPSDRGAGIFLYPITNGPTFRNCRITGNRVLFKGGAMYTYHCSSKFYNCIFENNLGDSGGAIYHLQSTPQYFDCIFRNNRSTGLAGAMYNYGSNATLTNCWFNDNEALGGGGMHNFQSNPILKNCVFQRNIASGGLSPSGGAMHNEPGSPTLINCILTANHADLRGGGIFNNDVASAPIIQNTVFFANTAGAGGGLAVNNGAPSVVNGIFWDNRNNNNQHAENTEIAVFGGTLSINYSSVMDWSGSLGGTGNAAFAPDFADADGLDDTLGTSDDNLRLTASSACINAGDPTALLATSGADADGHARVLCDRVDLGPYEFGLGDFNCDQLLDLSDFSHFPNCLFASWEGILDPGCEAYLFAYPGRIDLKTFAWWQNNLEPDGP